MITEIIELIVDAAVVGATTDEKSHKGCGCAIISIILLILIGIGIYFKDEIVNLL